ncbi:HET-domain-containing protein, partial [Echria macrotheca]
MWLLDVKSYVLVDVVNSTDVRYATLSHTWASEEVSFADIQNLRCAKKRLGWHKIEQSCHLAAQRGIDYVWIDTCCIDKSSSAELSEAINSMFAWYKDSHECYVHLSDLDPSDDLETALPKCRWFTRGWTLQELIAPKELLFYDNQWNFRGKKASMTKLLSQITNVDEKILLVPELLSLVSVGKRMSWAAKRQTTRLEDMAYCLFGIFGVNMPLIYGEGTNAFLRLQEAVALATEDLSLFAWTGTSADEGFPYSGILAHSPSQFAACRLLEKIDDPLESDSRSFTVVNRNVGFQACLRTDTNHGDYLMRLHCKDAGDRQDRTVVIRLVKTPGGFVRHSTDNVFYGELHHDVQDLESWDPVPRAVTISKRLSTVDLRSIQQRFSESFHFKVAAEGFYYKLTASMPELADETHSSTHWDSSTSRFLTEGHPLFTGLL